MSRTASAVWPRPEVTYANGDREVMYFNDFNSGTTIQNVVHPGKKNAITSVPATGQPGLRIQHLPDSIVDECAENEVAHHHQSR